MSNLNKYLQMIGSMGLNLQNQKNDSADNFLLSAKNIICKDGFLELRKHIRKVANFANPIKFLFPFEEFNVIIAATDNTIYILNERFEVLTSTGGYSSSDWVPCLFNHRVYLANSLDKAQVITNTGVDTFTIDEVNVTGTANKIFSFVSVVNSQLVFGKLNSLSFWYLPVGNVQGQLSEFDLSTAIGTTRLGGYIVNMMNLPRDSGMGMQDYVAIFTDKGEMIMYQTTDWSDADSINYKGTYLTNPFIGHNFITKYLNDLLLLTTNGIISAQDIINSGVSASTDVIFSAPINNQWNTQNFKIPGYIGLVVPQEDFMIFNVPTTTNENYQWVMDLSSHRWSSFTEINCYSICNFNENLLFGKDDGIYLYTNDAIPQDDEHWITSEIQTSYSNWGTINSKRFGLFNTRLLASSDLNITYEIRKELADSTYYNFISSSNIATSSMIDGGFFEINDAETDQRHIDDLFYWWIDDEEIDPTHKTVYWTVGSNGDLSEQNRWHSGSGYARNFSLILRMKTNNITYKLYDITYQFSQGAGI